MDWLRFFDDNQIAYITRGPNTKQGEVSIQCPWCGDDDPSAHLGVALDTPAYSCWRSLDHAGRSPSWLIAALLGCSSNQAKLIVGQYSVADPDDLDELFRLFEASCQAPEYTQNTEACQRTGYAQNFIACQSVEHQQGFLASQGSRNTQNPLACQRLESTQKSLACQSTEYTHNSSACQGKGSNQRPPACQHPKLAQSPQASSFKPPKSAGSTSKFWYYLKQRGFSQPDELIAKYKLKCALTGPQKDRIILPVYRDQNLIGWTGRAIINPKTAPRYLSSGPALKEVVYNEDELLQGGHLLFVTEGPFDMLKVDHCAPKGTKATCTFGVNVSNSQLSALLRLSHKFHKTIILFDQEAIDATFRLHDALSRPNIVIGELPTGTPDPGTLTKAQARALIASYA